MIELLQQGVTNAWFFVPTALLLGGLHGLEPGHSKTLMAAFIVAVRGTAAQALLLGLAATASHTLIVWIVALAGMAYFRNVDAEMIEPYFQFASGWLIIAIASWMAWRTWRAQHPQYAFAPASRHPRGHDHDHVHDHGHSHNHGRDHAHDAHRDARRGDDHGHDHHFDRRVAPRAVDTGHGLLTLGIEETRGASLHWTIRSQSGQAWNPRAAEVETTRPDGRVQAFTFTGAGGLLRSVQAIPEPVDFTARLSLGHGDHEHVYALSFGSDNDHDSEAHLNGPMHLHHDHPGLDGTGPDFADAHARAHAEEIRRRFSGGQNVTTGQIMLFGLTGGLIPCPAAITVLLLCLQLQQIWLGALLVLCFSIGLAATLIAVGVLAAVGVGQASKRLPWLDTVARRAPYVSSALIVAVGIYVVLTGWIGLTATLT